MTLVEDPRRAPVGSPPGRHRPGDTQGSRATGGRGRRPGLTSIRGVLSAAAGVPPGRRSSTGPVLRRLRGLLLVLSVLVLVGSSSAFTSSYGLAQLVRTGAVPALLDLSTARGALLDAEAVLVRSQAGDPERSFAEFRGQVQVAGQALTRAAGADVAEGANTQLLQSIQSQLVSYQGIAVALLFPPERDGPRLSHSDLVDAFVLMHDDKGMLNNLATLMTAQQASVNRRASAGWLSPWAVPAWLVPLLALFALLVGTQVFLTRRLHRTVNPALVVATVVLVGVAGYAAALVLDHRLDTGRNVLLTLVEDTSGRERTARVELRAAVGCPREDSPCGETLALAVPLVPVGVPVGSATKASRDLTQLTTPPSARPGLVLVPVAALVVGALGWIGLRRAVDEYRFQP